MATQAQLDRLKAAYYQGVLIVQEGDTRIEYQNMAQMRVAIKDLEDELKNNRPKGSRLVSVSKGY